MKRAGVIWYLFLPFIVLCVLSYFVAGDRDLGSGLLVIVTLAFSFFYVFTLTRIIWQKFSESRAGNDQEELLGIYISVLMWAALPVIIFYDGSQLLHNQGHCLG